MTPEEQIERTHQVNIEMMQLLAEFQALSEKAGLLVKKLDDLGVPLAPEVRALMFKVSKQPGA
jgi:hypothetical protein